MEPVVTVAEFLVRFPAFDSAGISHAVIEAQLADGNEAFSRPAFASDFSYRRAVMLFTAHNLVLAGIGENAEAKIVSQGFALDSVQSVSDSGVSVSLRDSSKDVASAYGSTSYGRELAKLIKTAVIGGTVAAGRMPFTPRTTSPAGAPQAPPVSGYPAIDPDPDNNLEIRSGGLFSATRLNRSDW